MHLEVVGAHEDVSDAGAHDPQDPLIEGLGLGDGGGIVDLGLHKAREATDLWGAGSEYSFLMILISI